MMISLNYHRQLPVALFWLPLRNFILQCSLQNKRSLSSFNRSTYLGKFCMRNLGRITAKKLDDDFLLAVKKLSSLLFCFSSCFWRSLSSTCKSDILFFISGCFSRILQLKIFSLGICLHVVLV